MTKIQNIARGPRGIRTKDGALIMLDAGDIRDDLDISKDEIRDARDAGWFAFDGDVIEAADLVTSEPDTPEMAALRQRADTAEAALVVANARIEELEAQLAGSPDEPDADLIRAAVDGLDPANDDHWTKAGLPDVKAVEAALGADVTRAQIEAAAPGVVRKV